LLKSPDLRMQDLNIAYNSVLLILRIIRHTPYNQKSYDDPVEVDAVKSKSLFLIIGSHDDPEILLKTREAYESIEQYVHKLQYEHNENDDVIYDHNVCSSVAEVIQSLKRHLESYAREVDQISKVASRDDLRQELVKILSNREYNVNQGYVESRNDYPEIPFYDVVDDPAGKEDDGGLFSEPNVDVDLEIFAKEMLPNFQFHKRERMSGDGSPKGRKLLKARTLSKLGGIAYESNARRNLGGGKTYQKNEFRSIHNNRKANTSRPPSVHVDDFMSGKIPANQQHPDMLNNSSVVTTNSRGGITTSTNTQIATSNRGGRGRRSSTSSVATSRGASRGGSSSGRGTGGIGRGGSTNTNLIGAWEMGNNTPWTGGPPSLPVLIPPPLHKYIEFDRQRDYNRYDGQTIRTGYYDNQYYGVPSQITPYDRPPLQQSPPGIAPRIKNPGDNRGRTVPQEWPRSMVSQPVRRPERSF
ncbi:15695_t:CDS:2, partial [Acaulospora colombiana]